MNNKIKNFTDLIAWQKGHELVLNIYSLTTSFPKEELYGITSQIRRCTVSITSNLAEGFSRRGSKEKVRFYYISLGSLSELQNQLIISRDLKYIDENKYKKLQISIIEVQKLINGLVKSIIS